MNIYVVFEQQCNSDAVIVGVAESHENALRRAAIHIKEAQDKFDAESQAEIEPHESSEWTACRDDRGQEAWWCEPDDGNGGLVWIVAVPAGEEAA